MRGPTEQPAAAVLASFAGSAEGLEAAVEDLVVVSGSVEVLGLALDHSFLDHLDPAAVVVVVSAPEAGPVVTVAAGLVELAGPEPDLAGLAEPVPALGPVAGHGRELEPGLERHVLLLVVEITPPFAPVA